MLGFTSETSSTSNPDLLEAISDRRDGRGESRRRQRDDGEVQAFGVLDFRMLRRKKMKGVYRTS